MKRTYTVNRGRYNQLVTVSEHHTVLSKGQAHKSFLKACQSLLESQGRQDDVSVVGGCHKKKTASGGA